MKRWDGIYRIVSPHIKREGPDGHIHFGWCAILEHECCSCRGKGRGGGNRIRGDDGGTKLKAPQKKQFEMA
jgi:hypothetical protein